MSFVGTLRRFHPFRPDLVALTEPPFDPRKQSLAVGMLAAAEALVGAVLALPLFASAATCVWLLLLSPGQRQTHHFHHVSVWLFYQLGWCTALAAAFLWAGVALMFGWRSRYRAHGALVFVLLVVAGTRWVALAAGAM